MLQIADKTLSSRLFLGTGKFASASLMEEAIIASGAQLVTVALKRVNPDDEDDDLLQHLHPTGAALMPNTSGARTAR